MSQPAPARKKAVRIRGGDLIRVMWKAPGRSQGRCTDSECGWTPVGTAPNNISRECLRHTRKTGHVTRFATVEVVEYRPVPDTRARQAAT